MMKISSKNIILMGIATFLMGSCGRTGEGSHASAELIPLSVTADFETEPLKNQPKTEDCADDPTVWINPDNPAKSYIIGTDKKTGGLAVYDLDGKEIFFYKDGKMNNADIRYGFPYQGKKIDIVACSNRTTRAVDIFQIHKDGTLTKLPTQGLQSPMEKNVYGFALGQSGDEYFAYVNSKQGEIVQWKLIADGKTVKGEIVRQLNMGTQLEGMVADDKTGTFFIGAEEKGIYYTTIKPNGESPKMIESSELTKNIYMSADIEGIAIYRASNQEYLLASSQGNFSYAVFDLNPPYQYIGSFRIADGIVDGVEETDGLEAIATPLGDKFPEGIFVVQDGFNRDNGKLKTQNFKVIDWRKIKTVIGKMK